MPMERQVKNMQGNLMTRCSGGVIMAAWWRTMQKYRQARGIKIDVKIVIVTY
jgi:hypothetical protein